MKYRLEVTRVTADTHAQMVAPHNLDRGSRIPPRRQQVWTADKLCLSLS